MKLSTLFFIGATLFAACNHDSKSDSAKADGDLAIRSEGKTLELPYPIERTDWVNGDDNNVPVAMNVLKSYEVKDFSGMRGYMADTVEFIYDNGNFKGTKDQVVKFLKNFRENRLDVKIKMNDYQALKRKSKQEDWVSLWYTETVTDKTGKMDSAQVMDEYRIQNGKVALIDTKFRHLGKN